MTMYSSTTASIKIQFWFAQWLVICLDQVSSRRGWIQWAILPRINKSQTTPYAGQLSDSKFDRKCVYKTIKALYNGFNLEYLLTAEAEARPLHELNHLFECLRIDANGVSTRVTFNELNCENYHWLQLNGNCMNSHLESRIWWASSTMLSFNPRL